MKNGYGDAGADLAEKAVGIEEFGKIETGNAAHSAQRDSGQVGGLDHPKPFAGSAKPTLGRGNVGSARQKFGGDTTGNRDLLRCAAGLSRAKICRAAADKECESVLDTNRFALELEEERTGGFDLGFRPGQFELIGFATGYANLDQLQVFFAQVERFFDDAHAVVARAPLAPGAGQFGFQ